MAQLTSWVRPKDVPLQMRPLVLHIGPYGGRPEDVRTLFLDVFRTSSGRNFAQWEQSTFGQPGKFPKKNARNILRNISLVFSHQKI